jgi:hypothetical protein
MRSIKIFEPPIKIYNLQETIDNWVSENQVKIINYTLEHIKDGTFILSILYDDNETSFYNFLDDDDGYNY